MRFLKRLFKKDENGNKISVPIIYETYKPSPIKLNFTELRNERQKINNNIIFQSVKTKNLIDFYENVNKNELKRVLDETNLTIEELLNECSKNDIMNKILSGRISKISSRQGINDEYLQVKVCNDISIMYGINIKKLKTTEYRATKNGDIINLSEMKKRNISKDNCLKSFDCKINGLINGWMFAKVVQGKGGHQDNVFEEADILCKWVENFRMNNNEFYIVLIDTDLEYKIMNLKYKYQHIKNIIITDHYEFQKYIIDNFELV